MISRLPNDLRCMIGKYVHQSSTKCIGKQLRKLIKMAEFVYRHSTETYITLVTPFGDHHICDRCYRDPFFWEVNDTIGWRAPRRVYKYPAYIRRFKYCSERQKFIVSDYPTKVCLPKNY